MSSTNKTEHYSLPQFIGSDIPTWLGDFNSAMTAIDSGINAAATEASRAATDAKAALNRCPFPIGYGGFFQTDPNSIYAGTTWEQKKDVFILASGDTYGAGSTGGEATHTLTVDELAKHDHIEGMQAANGLRAHCVMHGAGDRSGVPLQADKYETSAIVLSTDETGGSKAHNNMPPYYSMPFWIRTA